MSLEDCAEIKQLGAKARQILPIGPLPDDVVSALRSTEMAARHAHLDALADE